MKPTDFTIDIPGMTIAAREWGEPGGRPVLAVHGWLDNAATFDPLAPRLLAEDEELRIVAIDFPGHGLSEHRPPGTPYHFIDLIPVFFDVADALGWETFSLLGHSMGAGASTLVAGTEPERIERVALIDGLGPWTTPALEAPGQMAKGLKERETLLDKEKRTFDSLDDALETISTLYRLEPEQVRPLLDRGMEAVDGCYRFTYDLALRGASLMRLTEAQVGAFLRNIGCPVMLVRPDDGWPVDEKDLERRMDWIEDLQLMRVPGGHHVHLSHPQRIATALSGFLKGES